MKRGYWNDEFINYFATEPAERRPPLIHRGYYVRTMAVWQFVNSFLATAGPTAQIVNFGAGFDTLFWRLQVRLMADGTEIIPVHWIIPLVVTSPWLCVKTESRAGL